MGKAGGLAMRLDYIKVGDGKIRLRGTNGKEGESGVTSTVILTVLFGPIGLIKHGKEVQIKQGQALHAFVAEDVALAPATGTVAPASVEPVAVASVAMLPVVAAPVAVAPVVLAPIAAATLAAVPMVAAASLTIDASVPNCDIEVDGSFMGNTPSTLNLARGQHEIVVRRAGYKDWIRIMNVGGGSVRLSAEMLMLR
jgi:hypothetical protein